MTLPKCPTDSPQCTPNKDTNSYTIAHIYIQIQTQIQIQIQIQIRWHFLSAPLTLLSAQHCTPNKDTNTHSYICMYTNTDTDTIFPKIKNVWGFCFSVQKGSLHIYTKSYCSQKILVNMYLTKENSWNMSFKSRQIKFCSKVEMSGTSLIMVSIILNYILHKVSREIFNSCVPNGVILE